MIVGTYVPPKTSVSKINVNIRKGEKMRCDFQDQMKFVIGILLIIAAVILGFWLSLRVLLYGGIMQAVDNWGVDNGAVVWGIIKAWCCWAGIIPSYILGFIALMFFE